MLHDLSRLSGCLFWPDESSRPCGACFASKAVLVKSKSSSSLQYNQGGYQRESRPCLWQRECVPTFARMWVCDVLGPEGRPMHARGGGGGGGGDPMHARDDRPVGNHRQLARKTSQMPLHSSHPPPWQMALPAALPPAAAAEVELIHCILNIPSSYCHQLWKLLHHQASFFLAMFLARLLAVGLILLRRVE